MSEKFPQQFESPEDLQISQKEQELFEVLRVKTKEEAKNVDLNTLDPETIKKALDITEEIKELREKEETDGKEKERKTIPGTFENDKREDGWELERDSSDLGPVNIKILELISSDWETMGDAIKDANKELGQRTSEYLLRHSDEIPEEWQDKYLIFPGTEWHHSDGDRGVPCLRWHGNQWLLRFIWLDVEFGFNDRLVQLKNK